MFLSAVKGKLNPKDDPYPDWIFATYFSSSLSHHRGAAVVFPCCSQQKSVDSSTTSTTLMFPPAECQQTPQDPNVDFSVQELVRSVYKSFFFVYKLDHLYQRIIPALEWLGQTFMAKSSAS